MHFISYSYLTHSHELEYIGLPDPQCRYPYFTATIVHKLLRTHEHTSTRADEHINRHNFWFSSHSFLFLVFFFFDIACWSMYMCKFNYLLCELVGSVLFDGHMWVAFLPALIVTFWRINDYCVLIGIINAINFYLYMWIWEHICRCCYVLRLCFVPSSTRFLA